MRESCTEILVLLALIVSSTTFLIFSKHYPLPIAIIVLVTCVPFYFGGRWVRWLLFFPLVISSLIAVIVGVFSAGQNLLYGVAVLVAATIHFFSAIAIAFSDRVDDWFSAQKPTGPDVWFSLLSSRLEKPLRSRPKEPVANTGAGLRRLYWIRIISNVILALVALIVLLVAFVLLQEMARTAAMFFSAIFTLGRLKATTLWGLFSGPYAIQLGPQLSALLILVVLSYLGFYVVPFLCTFPISGPFAWLWRPARIMLLRPFNRDTRTRRLQRIVRRQLSVFGHTYTLADADIRVRWYVKVPLILGQLSIFTFRMRRIRTLGDLYGLGRAVRRSWLRSVNWCLSMNKIFPVACSDDGWKACVAQLASDVDLILMDLTGLRENVLWELDLCDRRGLSNRLVLLADEREGKPAQRVAEQRGKDIYLYNNSGLAGELTLRQVIAETLARNGGAGSRVLDPVVDPQYKRRVIYRILVGLGLFAAIIVLVLMLWMLTSFR